MNLKSAGVDGEWMTGNLGLYHIGLWYTSTKGIPDGLTSNHQILIRPHTCQFPQVLQTIWGCFWDHLQASPETTSQHSQKSLSRYQNIWQLSSMIGFLDQFPGLHLPWSPDLSSTWIQEFVATYVCIKNPQLHHHGPWSVIQKLLEKHRDRQTFSNQETFPLPLPRRSM